MKVFLTGGAGFIGHHLVKRLLEAKHKVVVFDNLSRGKLTNIEPYLANESLQFIEGDICDEEALINASNGCDITIHLAAQSNVLGAVSDIDYSFSTNVIGTYNTLKASQKNNISRFVFSSSREVYGEAENLPVNEQHALNSKNSYGASKVAGEKYCQVFQNMYNMDMAILRFSNVYGMSDFNRVIPIFIDKIKKGENVVIYGGKQVLDFVSVDIITKTIMECVTTPKALPGPVNVGSGKATTLFELAERLKEELGSESKIVIEPAREAEVVRFVASNAKFKEIFQTEIPEDPLFGLGKMV